MGQIVYQDLNLTLASDATQDIWSLFGTTAVKIKMLGWELTSEAVAVSLLNMHFHRVSTVGTGGSDATEEPSSEQGGTILGTVRIKDTAPATNAGLMMSYAWEQQGPVGHIWTPEMQTTSKVSEGFALTVDTAQAAVLRGWICWEEV